MSNKTIKKMWKDPSIDLEFSKLAPTYTAMIIVKLCKEFPGEELDILKKSLDLLQAESS